MRHVLCFPDSPVGYEAEHRVLPCFLRLFVVFLASHAEQCSQREGTCSPCDVQSRLLTENFAVLVETSKRPLDCEHSSMTSGHHYK